MENRNGLIVDAEVFRANGTAEPDAALVLLEQIPGTQAVTVAGDKGFDNVRVCGGMPKPACGASRGAKTIRGAGAARLMATPHGTRATP